MHNKHLTEFSYFSPRLGDKQSRDRGNYKKTDKTLKTPRKLGKIKRKPS